MALERPTYRQTCDTISTSSAFAQRSRQVLLAAAMLFGAAQGLYAVPGVAGVEASRPFFNPELGQRIEISFQIGETGLATVRIQDRDGQPVRLLATKKPMSPGRVSLEWDGRDDDGVVVPDEAYSVAIEFGRSESARPVRYPKTNRGVKEIKVAAANYDPASGVISYKLPEPARVEIQATCLTSSPYEGRRVSVVAGAPRAAGSVIDIWNGFDRNGKLYLVDQPGFTLSVTATSLPLPALITVGNRSVDFETYRQKRKVSVTARIAAALAGGR